MVASAVVAAFGPAHDGTRANVGGGGKQGEALPREKCGSPAAKHTDHSIADTYIYVVDRRNLFCGGGST